jgi:hypothetical protein
MFVKFDKSNICTPAGQSTCDRNASGNDEADVLRFARMIAEKKSGGHCGTHHHGAADKTAKIEAELRHLAHKAGGKKSSDPCAAHHGHGGKHGSCAAHHGGSDQPFAGREERKESAPSAYAITTAAIGEEGAGGGMVITAIEAESGGDLPFATQALGEDGGKENTFTSWMLGEEGGKRIP